MSTSTLSVIVPTLNESNHIHQTLQRIREKGGDFLIEIWVVDAGSTDGTPDRAAPFASVLHSYRGRALQMNAGAALASGDVLLFCHGDTLLPRDYASQISQALQDPSVVGGAFSHHWDSSSRLLRMLEWAVSLPYHYCMFGDQGIFVRRTVFEAMGGFPVVPLMEDVRFIRNLNRSGKLVRLKPRVTTSARRFHENGVLRQILLDLRIYLADLLGADPQDLARQYHVTNRDPHPGHAEEILLGHPRNS